MTSQVDEAALAAMRGDTEATQARILCVDIETRPLLAYTWGTFKQHISPAQIVHPGGTMCFAAKWYAEHRVHFYSDHHDGHDAMLQAAHELLSEADVVVGYNHRSFDVKHLHREFVVAGMPPPAPHIDVDLLTVARRRFRFPSNKLDHVSRELDIGFKVPTGGFELWKECMAGDAKAWATMKRYNVHDVRLTEELFDRLRAWLPPGMNLNVLRPERLSGCDKCGHTEVEPAGFHYTQTRVYARFRCVSCGGYSRATHHEPDKAQHRKGV